MTKCQICGVVIRDDMKFCVKCTIDRAHSQAMKKNPDTNPGKGNNSEGVVCFGQNVEQQTKKHVADESRKTLPCTICANLFVKANLAECGSCTNVVCKDHFNKKNNLCNECFNNEKHQARKQFRQKFLDLFMDGKFGREGETILILEMERERLGLSKEEVEKISDSVYKAKADVSKELLLAEKLDLDEARRLLIDDFDVKNALAAFGNLYGKHPKNLEVTSLYLQIMFEHDLDSLLPEINKMIGGSAIPNKEAYLTKIDILSINGSFAEAQETLKQAKSIKTWRNDLEIKIKEAELMIDISLGQKKVHLLEGARSIFKAINKEIKGSAKSDFIPRELLLKYYLDYANGDWQALEKGKKEIRKANLSPYFFNKKIASIEIGRKYFQKGYALWKSSADDQNKEQALFWFKKALARDDLQSLKIRATMHEQGIYLERSWEKALSYYEKLANLGDRSACLRTGEYNQRGWGTKIDYVQAIDKYLKVLDETDRYSEDALGLLAEMHGQGLGSRQDFRKVLEFFQKLAEKGDPFNQARLGDMYLNGMGTDQDYSEALKWYLKSAAANDDRGQERLGDMYLKGMGTDIDYNKALEWYLKSAEQGNDASKVQLGYLYEQSLGVDQDYQKALALYREAAEEGNALGQARLGDMYYRGIGVEKDYEKAFACFQESAVQGNDHSLAKLGDMFLHGLGVKADHQKALAWYQESAERGNGHSQAQLAGMYLYGVDVDQDYQKALAWYRKLVEQGNAEAQVNLGHMLEKGLGVDKDFQKALELYRKSAEQGHALGQARLGDLYLKGLGVAQDPQKAFACFQKSAERGNDLAQLRLGTMYCEGNGVEKDLEKGFELVQKSAKQGNAKAQLLLGGMYKDGKGVQQDNKNAFAWIQKSAKQGNIIAQNNLGYLYEQGLGVDRDFQKAREWYLKAAEKGFDAAQMCLGNIYRDGLGVEENINEAKKWYVKAAEKGNEKAKSELLKIEQEADPKKKLKNKILASYKGDAKAMAEVANMYLMGIGVEKSEENALEWFKKAVDYGNVSVRGQLLQVQQSINAKPKVENKIPETKSQIAVPYQSVQKKKSHAARTLFFLFSIIGAIGLSLIIIFFNTIKKSGSSDHESPPVVMEIAEPPKPRTELIVPAIPETIPEATKEIKKGKSAINQKEKKPVKIAKAEHALINIKPVAVILRREYKSLNEQEISEMLGAKNIFDAKKNPTGNFRHEYEIRNVAGLRVIFDRVTKLAWMRQQNLIKMNLEKTKDWIGSLNNVKYGGISNWRLPTVEEAASLLEKNPDDEKIFLDAIFGKDIKSIWTGDSFTESMSWIIDFQNGLIDYEKNKNHLPALMVSFRSDKDG